MFIAPFAAGFGATRLAPSVSLGMLFLAAQLADLIWPNLVALGGGPKLGLGLWSSLPALGVSGRGEHSWLRWQ